MGLGLGVRGVIGTKQVITVFVQTGTCPGKIFSSSREIIIFRVRLPVIINFTSKDGHG
jgi:hypothetical protein